MWSACNGHEAAEEILLTWRGRAGYHCWSGDSGCRWVWCEAFVSELDLGPLACAESSQVVVKMSAAFILRKPVHRIAPIICILVLFRLRLYLFDSAILY